MIVQASTRGDVRIMSTLTRWAERAGNSEPAMIAIGEYMQECEKELFATSGASSGRPWADLADSTKEARTDDEGFKILIKSQALFNSLTEWEDENAIRTIGPGFIRFGTRLGYAELLRRGFRDRAGNRVAPRRPIDFNSHQRYVILKIVASWVTGRSRISPRPGLRFL